MSSYPIRGEQVEHTPGQGWKCSCFDFQETGRRCTHIVEASAMVSLEGAMDGVSSSQRQ